MNDPETHTPADRDTTRESSTSSSESREMPPVSVPEDPTVTEADSAGSTESHKTEYKPSVIKPLGSRGRTDQLPSLPPDPDDKSGPGDPIVNTNPVKFDPSYFKPLPPRSDELPARPVVKPDPTRETAVLSDNNPILKRMMRQSNPGGTASLGGGREVILVIRGMVERIVMVEGKTYKLGRFEISTRHDDEIDLSPYGALDRGVSRVHAELHIKGENIYITDLTSTNGTYQAGIRLKPNEATLLRKGDELLIGRLPIQILFR